jgi:hydrogenase/urease accessory protein HupE
VYALSWLFLAVAVGSLLLGFGRAGLGLIYLSIAASVLAMGFLLAAVLRRPAGRGEEPRSSERSGGRSTPG